MYTHYPLLYTTELTDLIVIIISSLPALSSAHNTACCHCKPSEHRLTTAVPSSPALTVPPPPIPSETGQFE